MLDRSIVDLLRVGKNKTETDLFSDLILTIIKLLMSRENGSKLKNISRNRQRN